MKKNYLRLLSISLAVAMSFGFVSCKGDDDDGNDPGDEKVVSGVAEKFIGVWRANGYGDGFFFLPNGLCEEYHDFFSSGPGRFLSEWTYDESTKQLATTLSGNSWTVSMITNEAWTGISLKDGKSVTYKRDNNYFLTAFLDMMDDSWTGEMSLDLQPNYSATYIVNGYMVAYTPLVSATNDNIKITKDNIIASNVTLQAYVFNNESIMQKGGETKDVFTGNVTISNYGKKNAKMTMDGTIIATGGKINKTYGARKYIKDKAIGPVEE